MARPLFARGARGASIELLQKPLLPPAAVDGIYGDDTTAAVSDFQRRRGIAVTGAVDSDLWTTITKRPLPPTFDRALAVTATMEGHGYTLAEGNFDGAGITWGIVGYTLKFGELAHVIDLIDRAVPGVVQASFGNLTSDLRRLLALDDARAIAFAGSLSKGAHLRDDWRDAFARLGSDRRVQQVQYDYARSEYGGRALNIAREFGLRTELGFALAFDIGVQNGMKQSVRAAVHRQLDAHPISSESEVRSLIAHGVADAARREYQHDVLVRKMTFVGGSGIVHGRTYVLSNWGLGEFAMDR